MPFYAFSILLGLLAVAPSSTSRPASSEVEFSTSFTNGARFRVIREPIGEDVPALLERQRDALSRATNGYVGERTARYRFVFSSKPGEAEREVLTEYDSAAGGQRSTYHTWTALLADESLLLVIHSSGPGDFLRVIDVAPGQPQRKLPPDPFSLITWGTTGPRFSSAGVTGSFDKGTLTIELSLRPDPFEKTRGAWQEPLERSLRLRLQQLHGEWAWVELSDETTKPSTRGKSQELGAHRGN